MINSHACFRTSSDDFDSFTLAEFLNLLLWNLDLFRLVTTLHRVIRLVCKNDYVNIVSYIILNLSQPWVNVSEWFTICNIKNNNNAVCTFVISICDSSVPFLASCIPNLKFSRHFIDLKSAETLFKKFYVMKILQNRHRSCISSFLGNSHPT